MQNTTRWYILTKILLASVVFILSLIEYISSSEILCHRAFIGRAILNLLYITDIVFIKLKLIPTRLTSALIHLVTRNFILLFIIGFMKIEQYSFSISICWFLLDFSHYIYSWFRVKFLRICRYYLIFSIYPFSFILECLSIYRSIKRGNSYLLNIIIGSCLVLYSYTSLYLFFRVLRQRHWLNLRENSEKTITLRK